MGYLRFRSAECLYRLRCGRESTSLDQGRFCFFRVRKDVFDVNSWQFNHRIIDVRSTRLANVLSVWSENRLHSEVENRAFQPSTCPSALLCSPDIPLNSRWDSYSPSGRCSLSRLPPPIIATRSSRKAAKAPFPRGVGRK